MMTEIKKSHVDAWATFLHKNRFLFLLLILSAMAWAGLMARSLAIDPSNDPFFIKQGQSWKQYQDFVALYGHTDTISVGLRLPSRLDSSSASMLSRIENLAAGIEGVERVIGLSNTYEVKLSMAGPIKIPFLQALIEAQLDSEAFFARRPKWPDPARMMISEDGDFTAFTLVIDHTPQTAERVLKALKPILAAQLPPKAQYLLTGTAVEQQVFSHKIDEDRKLFVPLCIAAIVILLLVFYPGWDTLIYSLLVMIGALFFTEASMALFAVKMHAVTSLLSPVIMIVAVSLTVKIAGFFSEAAVIEDKPRRLYHVFRATFIPCFLAALTTWIGFLSLLVSGIPAIREFGIFGALGTAAAWLLAVTLAPVFSARAKKHAANNSFFQKAGQMLCDKSKDRTRLILVIATGFVLLCALWMPRISTSTDFLKVFKPNDAFVQDTREFQKKMGGVYSLEMSLEAPESAVMTQAETWNRVDAFTKKINGLDQVSHVFGLHRVIAYFEDISTAKRTDVMLRNILRGLIASAPELVSSLSADNYHKLRLTVFMYTSDTSIMGKVIKQAPVICEDVFGGHWKVIVTGESQLLSEMSDALVRDEIASVFTAFFIILALAIPVMRSFKYACYCLIPNLFPIMGLFGAMALFNIALNTATAMIASVAIGLIFDNTVYFLHGYRQARVEGMTVEQSIQHSSSQRLQSMLASSLILMGGFGVTVFGQMVPTSQFGMLCCLTIALTLFSDLILLPALLRTFGPKG